MNLTMLQDRITASKIKKSAFKDAIGCTYNTFQNKMDGKTEFTIGEINVIAEMLHLTKEEITSIFFGNDAYKM